MKGHDMMKNLPKNVCYEVVLPKYQKLVMLKKAFMINKNEEVSEKTLLEKAKEHNLIELFLIGYLVDIVMNAPKEVKRQNDLLIESSNIPREYAKVKKQTEKMFKTNPKFMRYSGKICSDLDLMSQRNCAITNLTLFGLCPEIILKKSELEPTNVVMNFHILQEWLSEQRKVDFYLMSEIEKKAVLYLANGYSPKDLLEENFLGDEERTKSVLFEILPARCNVQSVCQVMAVMFMSNLDLVDINKSIAMLDEFSENEDF